MPTIAFHKTLALAALLLAAAASARAADAEAPIEPAEPAADGVPARTVPDPNHPRQQQLLNIVNEDVLNVWDIEGDPKRWEAWAVDQTENGNAAAHFFKLAELYPEEKDEGRKVTVQPDSRGVQELLAAARQKECRLAPDFYPLPESGDAPQPDYVVLVAYGRALSEYARRLSRQGRIPEAEFAHRAGILCGRHLARDASSLLVYMAGLSMSQYAARAYAAFLRERMRLEDAVQAETYVREISRLRKRLQFKSQVLLGEMRNFACLPAMARIAREDEQRFWRQEAVTRLGVLRWGAPSGQVDADGKQVMDHDPVMQNHAAETLTWVRQHDPDPAMRAYAVWAFQTLTPEIFVEIRHRALVIRSADGENAADAAKDE